MLKPAEMSLKKQQPGFTLVELVIGIVVLAIALTIITGVLGPLYQRSTDPWHQVRAAELGHSFMNEIMARSFDENSDQAGSEFRCDASSVSTDATYEPGAAPCSDEPVFTTPALACANQVAVVNVCGSTPCWGPDSDDAGGRSGFDDVDDFHGFVGSGSSLLNVLGDDLADSYTNYKVCIDVRYAGADLGDPNNRAAKRITVSVVTPSGEQIDFSAYRSNW
jgi:MSHA pilin protein MshD